MQSSESSFIHIVRSITLLATLTFVPGIAVFWNLLPGKMEDISTLRSAQMKENGRLMDGTDSRISTSTIPAVPLAAPLATSEIPAPHSARDWNLTQTHPVQAVPLQPSPPQDFTSLEQRLKALGATEYQLTKFGNQGELLKFSCYVTPSESHVYKKFFQAIGTDALAVMQSVITEIEQWKSTGNF